MNKVDSLTVSHTLVMIARRQQPPQEASLLMDMVTICSTSSSHSSRGIFSRYLWSSIPYRMPAPEPPIAAGCRSHIPPRGMVHTWPPWLWWSQPATATQIKSKSVVRPRFE